MILKSIWLILFSVMLPVAAEPSVASAAGCDLDHQVYTREPAAIRATPHSNGAFVRNTTAGESHYIIDLRRSNGSCWLQTNEGWLIYDPQVISDAYEVFGAEEDAMSAGQPPCPKGETAYITGAMNIRESPSTSSPIVATAQDGDAFTVIEKSVGAKWCWLKISLGWLANTARVKTDADYGFIERDTAPTTMPADIDNCCFVNQQCRTERDWIRGYWAHLYRQCSAQLQFSDSNLPRPHIEGSEAFVNMVNETLNLTERKAPHIHRYIVSVTTVVEEHGPDHCDWGFAFVGKGITSLGSCLKQMPEPLYVLAAYLAHEACHHHGDDVNTETGEPDHQPCYKAGHDARAQLSAWIPHS